MTIYVDVSHETLRHVGTFENERGYVEIYDTQNGSDETHRVFFAGYPTNNIILPLWHEGKIVCTIYETDNTFECGDALSELIETLNEIKEL